ncbi:MAG: cobalamin-binding protein [Betaproteobacteria bacterium]|nr:MAG: cobalamin-binding protein [Betaproteobacteria bacterium]
MAVCRAEVSALDDAGRQITITEPARRIIAVAPHLAELTYAAGAGQRLIATVRGADYPSDVLALPSVGDAAGLDFERIRQLEPDLILAWGSGNKPADLERLASGLAAVFVMEPRDLKDISRHLRMIGRLAGTQAVAENAAARVERKLQQLRQRYAGASTIDVVVEIWHQPLFTVGDEHLLSNALRVCGARNALPDYPLPAGPVPLEDVLAADADVILSVTGMTQAEAQASWSQYRSVSGYQGVQVVAVDPDLLTRPGPRMLQGIEMLCTQLEQVREEARRKGRAGAPLAGM